MEPIFKKLKKSLKNEYAFSLDDQDNPYAVTKWIDSGCYILNAALSDGDIFKGIPVGKRIIVAGPSGTAKSYFIMYLLKAYIEKQANPYVVFFESEGASTTNMAFDFGIPQDKIAIFPVQSVESFRTQVTTLLDEIAEMRLKEKDNPPNFIIVLDSLGMLGTEKEYKDAVSGSEKADMTRAKLIRSVFRLITLKLSLTQTTLIMANHTGANIGSMSPLPVMGGGDGVRYSSDVILMLSKAKEKEGTSHIGANISLRVDKSRYQPEGNKVKITLLFQKGLFKYSYLLDLGIEFGIIKKEGNSYVLPDGTKKMRKELIKNADQYFIGTVLDKLQESIYNNFKFGGEKQLVADGEEGSFETIDVDTEGEENGD